MKNKLIGIFIALTVLLELAMLGCSPRSNTSTDSLHEAFSGIFFIGTAMDIPQITGENQQALDVIKRHFNSIVAENCMKSVSIQPVKGQFDFTHSDQFMAFGRENGMHIVGHTLIWHSQAPDWFFVDKNGGVVSPEVLAERMRTHIYTLAGRYKGQVHGWDVVNEAIMEDGSWRNSMFYQILGEDFVRLAFEFAHETDPDAELYYNDYGMANPGRREGVIRMVKDLQAQGIRIDGIGMQGHVHLDSPTIEEFEESIVAFSELGLKVMITELDVTVLPWPGTFVSADVAMSAAYQAEMNPYADNLPDDVYEELRNRYLDLFRLFIKHQDHISRVTTWGVHDGQSWRNYWPVEGRVDYPLLFDRNYEPKPFVLEIIDMGNEARK